MTRNKTVLKNIIAVVLILLVIFLQKPNLNPLYPGGAFFWCIVISAFILLNGFSPKKMFYTTTINGKVQIVFNKSNKYKKFRLLYSFLSGQYFLLF